MAPYELEKLSLEHIGQKGHLIKCVDEALDRVCRDITERPDVTKARTVTVEIELRPDDGGNVEIVSRVKHKVPPKKALTTRAITRDGKVMVNSYFEEPLQPPLPNVFTMTKSK